MEVFSLKITVITLILAALSSTVERIQRFVSTILYLFRDSIVVYLLPAMSTKGRFKLKRLLFFIRGSCVSRSGRLSHTLQERDKSCVALATA